MLSPYMSPVERVWFYSLRILCGLVLMFLILPVLVIVPLSLLVCLAAGYAREGVGRLLKLAERSLGPHA